MTVQIPPKRKHTGSPDEVARGWRRAGKWHPRTGGGNGKRPPPRRTTPPQLSVPSVNHMVLVVDARTGKARMRRAES
jgi:hypothetical protein